VIVLPVFTKLACDSIGMAVLDWLRNLRAVAEVSLGMGVVVYAASLLLGHEGVPAAARLAILVLLGLAVYVGLLRWRAPDVLGEIGRLRRRQAVPQAA
jgi:hypothetical protein